MKGNDHETVTEGAKTTLQREFQRHREFFLRKSAIRILRYKDTESCLQKTRIGYYENGTKNGKQLFRFKYFTVPTAPHPPPKTKKTKPH